MKISRHGAALAVALAGALTLSACTTSGKSSDASTGAATTTAAPTGVTGGTVTVAEVNQFFSFNSTTATGNVDVNSKIALATSSNFNYIDGDLKVQKDPGFGTYEVTSQDPLTVKYTINDGVKWSDGVQVGVDDLLLAWAVESGYYNDAKSDESGKVVSGTSYFDYAGSTVGLDSTSFPKIGDDGRSITLTYGTPYADWEVAYSLQGLPPAHVVWGKAGLADSQAFVDLLKGLKKGDPAHPVKGGDATLKKIAAIYNTGFDSKTLPSDKSLYLSDGPYVVSDVQEGKSVTLVPNTAYTGDHPARLDSIVMRTIGDAQAQIQALENGEVDVISPQADADTLAALKDVPGATVLKGNELSYDHVDLNFTGVFKDANVREAFLKTIPRQAILDAIITPLDPSAKVLDSQLFVPAQDGYAGAVAANGSSDYADVDIDGAKKLLNGATPTVRILYNSDNPNRRDAYTLIAASAKKAGFRVVDEGDVNWGSRLGDGSYDASIFGWISSGVGVSGVPQIFGSGQSSNFNGYSNKDADALMSTLVQTTEKAKQDTLEQQIDAKIWGDAYGLPLFQSIGVDAVSSRVEGITAYNPNQNGVWWNVWQWGVKG